jgi:uncharacterized protein YndB with AHSA1/START domain
VNERAEDLAVLVRAPVGAVYRVLTDVDDWPAWWAGCRVIRDTAHGGGDHHRLRLPAGWRPVRCRATVHGWRHEAGLRATLRDGADADVEWWLEPLADGTVVHALVAARGLRARRVLRAVGGGLQALKDHLELAVAVATGHVP